MFYGFDRQLWSFCKVDRKILRDAWYSEKYETQEEERPKSVRRAAAIVNEDIILQRTPGTIMNKTFLPS